MNECQREIQRLRALVREYGGFFDEVEKVIDAPNVTEKEAVAAIKKLIKEYDDDSILSGGAE